MKTKKVKAAGRYGARYGRAVRVKIAEIESIQRKKQNCIFCNGTAKRLSKGIWLCKKCGKKFASHTYYLPVKQEEKIVQ
jgi:large subunit ribosomal protein L37Ae